MRWVMNVVRVWVAAAVLALAGNLPAAQWARAAQGQTRPPHSQQTTVRVSMNQAIQMVETRFKARVVRADTRRQGGHVLYVMRLLDQHGRVFTVQVDASSGIIL